MWKLLRRHLRITLTLERDPASRKIRARALVVLLAVGFAVAGVVRSTSSMGLLAESPFDLDLALRTMSAGWFKPRDVLPVMLVEIDDATHRSWGSPAVTPRDSLASLIDTVARAGPRAVVVDIDLAWGGDVQGTADLRRFLSDYDGPAPLLFPKRLELAPGDNRQVAESSFDDLFSTNPHLAWAHASFETDSGGVVRQWADWIEVCNAESTEQLASIPARLSLMIDPLPRGLRRASPPPLRGACNGLDDPRGQLLLIGPRLTGPTRIGLSAVSGSISAMTLLDSEMDRDDAWLFGERVVLIGATYPASGDSWLTPSGVLPGVELLAHTVHYATLVSPPGWRSDVAFRVATLVGFLLFVAIGLWLRGLAAALGYVVGGLAIVAVPIWIWEYYRIFEALELAVMLVVAYKFLDAVLDMIEDWKRERAGHPAGWGGNLATLWATCRQPASEGDTDD